MNFDEMLGRYTVTDNDDGSKNIVGVPIFQIGFKRGDKVYDDEWADKAIKAHNDIKEQDGYVPPVFIGHTKEGEEKPATGHFDNLRKMGQKLLADFVRIPGKVYEEIKGGMWPNRSIEAVNTKDDSRVLGLALLGSSTPACKFGPMHFDGNPEDIEQIKFVDAFADAVATGLTYELLSRKIQEELERELEQVSNATVSVAQLEKAHVYVKAVYVNTPIAIVQKDGDVYSCTYVIGQDNSVAVSNLIAVEEQYIPIIQRALSLSEDVAEVDVIEPELEKETIMADEAKVEDVVEEVVVAEPVVDKASEKLLEKVEDNEKAQMAEKIAALEARQAETDEKLKATERSALEAKVDSFIEIANKNGSLPKALIQFDDVTDKVAFRDMLLDADDATRERIMKFTSKIRKVVQFEESAVQGDEEAKEAASSPKAIEQRFADLSNARAEEKKIDIRVAQKEICAENADIAKYYESLITG